jgi:predicted component of type VI protein secretion system
VTLGANDQPDAALDINLLDLEDKQRSVSVRHVKLRPSKERLFVLDLGSRNGTYANGAPIASSSAYPLQDGDLLTLGRLHLRVKIVQRPAD